MGILIISHSTWGYDVSRSAFPNIRIPSASSGIIKMHYCHLPGLGGSAGHAGWTLMAVVMDGVMKIKRELRSSLSEYSLSTWQPLLILGLLSWCAFYKSILCYPFNSLAHGDLTTLQSQISNFQTHFNDKYLKYFLRNCYEVNATISHWSLVNIGSGNGLVPPGNKPLPEPMLT